MPLVSVIVVSYGEKGYWQHCLEAVFRQTHKAVEVIFVDNSSGSSLSSEVQAQYPQIRYYSENKNLFYTGALNKGISLSQGEFILCLNDDVIIDPDFIRQLAQSMEGDPAAGMASGKLLRPGGAVIDSAGLRLSIFRTAKERGYNALNKGQFNSREYIFGPSGAAAFFRKEALEKIRTAGDYFDPDFRMFYEDLDIAWRLQRSGWKCAYVPEAVAYHARGASCRSQNGMNKRFARQYLSERLYWDLIKNRYLAMVKNETIPGFLVHLPFVIIYDLIAWLILLLTRPALVANVPSLIKLINSALSRRKLVTVIG